MVDDKVSPAAGVGRNVILDSRGVCNCLDVFITLGLGFRDPKLYQYQGKSLKAVRSSRGWPDRLLPHWATRCNPNELLTVDRERERERERESS